MLNMSGYYITGSDNLLLFVQNESTTYMETYSDELILFEKTELSSLLLDILNITLGFDYIGEL